MRIWHITTEPPMPGLYTGGMGVHIWNLAKEQASIGHEVTVYCPIKASEHLEGVTFKPWEYHVPKFQTEMAFQIEVARRTVKKLFLQGVNSKPDMIHCHEWDSACIALDLATYLQVPCIGTLHISNTLNSAYMTPLHTELEHYYLWWEQEMMRRADAMIAISDHYRKWIEVFNHRKPVRTIPNGIQISDFENGVERAKPDDRLLAFFHGRLVGQKGIELIVEAAKQADDIYWVLAGPIAAKEDGRCLEDGLLSDLRDLENQGKVLLTGMIPQAEIGAWLRACDVAVYPHVAAPFDCAVLEAMACGAPVITSGVEAIGEYTEHGETAWIYEQQHYMHLLGAIYHVCSNRFLRESLSMKAKTFARQFKWRTTATQTLNFYNEVMNGKASSERECAHQ